MFHRGLTKTARFVKSRSSAIVWKSIIKRFVSIQFVLYSSVAVRDQIFVGMVAAFQLKHLLCSL